MSQTDSLILLPTFLRRLSAPSIKTVMLCGCGGGFDFVHSLTLYPQLRQLGKSIVIGSYSFGDPEKITGETEIVFSESDVVVKRVTAETTADPYYGPEVHVCSFLDSQYPESAPHFVYAYYARAFTVPLLTRLYEGLIREHSVDALVIVDGGSDSLMAGDEEGLGDPIEDAVSVTTVAGLDHLKAKILVSIGLGTDRYNHVSDVASLRAVAELTRRGGFLGCASLEPSNPCFVFYRKCLEHIYEHQGFRSVLAGTIVSAAEGRFGMESPSPLVPNSVKPGELFLWPLMAVLWAFDVERVSERSLISAWIRPCKTVSECYQAVVAGRAALTSRLRNIEDFPRHEEMRW